MYQPRRPEATALRQILVSFLASTRDELAEKDMYLPRFVWRELEAIIDCGVLDRGFVRVVCDACKHERNVGFSCKGRGVCSSCVGRKMAELSQHLFDHVIPDVPLRQFVLTLPPPLRFLVARDKRLLCAVRTIALRAIKCFVCRKARDAYPSKDFLPAGFCVVQRSGSALNLAPHLHAVLFDGAYRKDDAGHLHFVAAPAVSPAERLKLVTAIATRIERLLKRRHILDGDTFRDDATDSSDPLLQLSLEAMKVAASRKTNEQPDTRSNSSTVHGFNLHCETRISVNDAAARMRLFRYVLRPAIAKDRLHLQDGVVTFTMKRVFADGTHVLKFTPAAFIRRIAMLVPAPRQHEITYVGLLAANAKHRNDIVRVPTHRRKPTPKPESTAPDTEPASTPNAVVLPPSSRINWADLLRKTFACDVSKCDQCGGHARVIAVITEPDVIEKILTHRRAIRDGDPKSARAPPVALPSFDAMPF